MEIAVFAKVMDALGRIGKKTDTASSSGTMFARMGDLKNTVDTRNILWNTYKSYINPLSTFSDLTYNTGGVVNATSGSVIARNLTIASGTTLTGVVTPFYVICDTLNLSGSISPMQKANNVTANNNAGYGGGGAGTVIVIARQIIGAGSVLANGTPGGNATVGGSNLSGNNGTSSYFLNANGSASPVTGYVSSNAYAGGTKVSQGSFSDFPFCFYYPTWLDLSNKWLSASITGISDIYGGSGSQGSQSSGSSNYANGGGGGGGVLADGGAGGAATVTGAGAGGGGGGAGGIIYVITETAIPAITVSANGGNGGNAYTVGGGGGGGGGGSILLYCPSTSAITSATAGNGGAKAGGSVVGSVGSAGTVNTMFFSA